MTAKIVCIIVVAVATVALMFVVDRFLPRGEDKKKDGEESD